MRLSAILSATVAIWPIGVTAQDYRPADEPPMVVDFVWSGATETVRCEWDGREEPRRGCIVKATQLKDGAPQRCVARGSQHTRGVLGGSHGPAATAEMMGRIIAACKRVLRGETH